MQNEVRSAKQNLQYLSGSGQDEGLKKNPTMARQMLLFRIRCPSTNSTINTENYAKEL